MGESHQILPDYVFECAEPRDPRAKCVCWSLTDAPARWLQVSTARPGATDCDAGCSQAVRCVSQGRSSVNSFCAYSYLLLLMSYVYFTNILYCVIIYGAGKYIYERRTNALDLHGSSSFPLPFRCPVQEWRGGGGAGRREVREGAEKSEVTGV